LKQVLFWAVRFATIAAAFSGSFWLTFAISLLQFVVLPYSLFAAVAYGLETVFALYSGHIVVFPALTWLLRRILPTVLHPTLVITPRFMIAFFVLDQLSCAACLFRTPKGKTAAMPIRRVMASVLYGFLNCKTYWLVLLPLCLGLEVPLAAWAVDAALGLSNKVNSRLRRYYQVLFYHMHRIEHLGHVYSDAHKFHHYLHDTTAFDAHIFGSGAPEEWLILMTDVVLALGFGVVPASLSYDVLQMSWFDKWMMHTRCERPALHEDNFHADHHTGHVVNFGFTYPYELLMKTAPKDVATKAEFSGFEIRREESDDTVVLKFTPVVPARDSPIGIGEGCPLKKEH
jgi:hypothetical protein